MSDYLNRFDGGIWSRLTKGSKIGSGSSAIGLIAFFLPWILVSCGGQTARISGYHLATASGPLSGSEADPQGQLIFVALGFIGVIFITYRYLQRLVIEKEDSVGLLAIGGLLIFIHFGIYSAILSKISNSSPFSMQIGYIQYGFWLSFLSSAGVTVGGYLNYRDSTVQITGPPKSEPPTKVQDARIELISGDKKGLTIPLAGDRITIGRGSKAAIRLSDKFVSRMHARLAYANSVWFLQDLKSAGGTYLNGDKIISSRIEDGDEIRLGETRMQFWTS